MKKAIAIILAAGMMLAMAACGATPASSTGTSAPAGSSSAQGQATRTYFINPKWWVPPIGRRPKKVPCRPGKTLAWK